MIIGTAGHIDHGKTALVRALTGVETDRLKEEKSRGISIDLGFAYMPAGERVIGFVDVPGHERFIRNMLAGATGIDCMLLVVAADDGVMPQTREHFSIVNLLGIETGLVAITKIDTVSEDRVAEVIAEVRALLSRSRFRGAPVFPVSAVTGYGIDTLRGAILATPEPTARHRPHSRFRLAIDRCFSLTGAGTVVTGAVMSGSVRIGDNVVVSPTGLKARVRSLHAQNRDAKQGQMGQRLALNLVGEGISKTSVGRGDILVDPALHAPCDRIDVEITALATAATSLPHWMPVRLHHGTGEAGARLAALDGKPLLAGTTGLMQLVLEDPIAAAVGDRFVVRDTSGSRTLGGGRFVDLRAPHRGRGTARRLQQLASLAHDDPDFALAAALEHWPFAIDLDAFARDHALDGVWETAAATAGGRRAVAAGEGRLLFSATTWADLEQSAVDAIRAYHEEFPAKSGLSMVKLAARLEPSLAARAASAVLQALVADGKLAFTGGAVHLPGRHASLGEKDERLWSAIKLQIGGANRFRPPRPEEMCATLCSNETEVRRVLKLLARRREVWEAAPDHFFLRDTMIEIVEIVAALSSGARDGWFSAAQLRDRLDNGRKIAIQILENFDRQGLTIRRGDLRRVNPQKLDLFGARTEKSAHA